MIDKGGSSARRRNPNGFNRNAEGGTMYYYSIFQWLFKFVPRYRFEKSVENHFVGRYRRRFAVITGADQPEFFSIRSMFLPE